VVVVVRIDMILTVLNYLLLAAYT